jgi:VanZ family protein
MQGKRLEKKIYLTAFAWLSLTLLVILSLVPPDLRPTTPLPHNVEHGVAFLATGVAFGFSYAAFERRLSLAAVAFCGSIELSQLLVVGRHARFSDFWVDVFGSLAGIFFGSAARRRVFRNLCVRMFWCSIHSLVAGCDRSIGS